MPENEKKKKIIFDLKEFETWIEGLGCDCCMQGRLHLIGTTLILDWESNINHVITKHRDIILRGVMIK